MKQIKQVKHVFSREEKEAISDQLVEGMNKVGRIKGDRDDVAAQFKAKLKEAELAVERLRGLLTSGYEMRPTECTVRLRPEAGQKDFVLSDGTVACTEEMNQSDFQLETTPRPDENVPKVPTQEATPDTIGVNIERVRIWGEDPIDSLTHLGCWMEVQSEGPAHWMAQIYLRIEDGERIWCSSVHKTVSGRVGAITLAISKLRTHLKKTYKELAEGFEKDIKAFFDANYERVE